MIQDHRGDASGNDAGAAKPDAKPGNRRTTLADLLALCDPAAPMSEEGRAWTSGAAVGKEII